MVTIFECLGCGQESILERLPAKCPTCHGGNGVLQEVDEAPPRLFRTPRSSDENAPGE